jgi:hypothetical protein
MGNFDSVEREPICAIATSRISTAVIAPPGGYRQTKRPTARRSPKRASAAIPEISVEAQQKRSLYQYSQAEAARHRLGASHEPRGDQEIENIQPGIESQNRQ